MKQAVRAIVIKDGALLVMHRNKFGHEYYTLVGGGVDHGEHPEQSLYREIAEETGVRVANHRLVFVEDAGDMYGIQYVYVCDYVSGEPALAPDAEEAHISALGQNLYTPGWLPLAQLPQTEFMSHGLRDRILRCLREGWPAEPEHFKTSH
jgi:8-oxo-dGTP diphosphatase